MTEELKQAAQQAISALQCAKRGHCDHAMADEAITALERALTAAQPAPEVAAVNTREQTFQNGYRIGYQAGRASLPTQPAAQATPEPVGEPTVNWFGTHFTYKNQPCDNVTAWRFGEAAMTAKPGGDLIDHGLSLLHELEKRGYGIFTLAAAQAKGGDHD